MFALIAAIIFSVISVVTVLLVLGFPLGEFAMGGQHRILPPKHKIMAFLMLVIQVFAIIIALQAGGYLPLWFSGRATRNICLVYAVFLSFNTIMNFFSRSKKERYVMTPLSFLAAICFWVIGFQEAIVQH